ncbi:HTH-type transcriptional repressor RspR [Fretibacterium fastidiosum]|mgnify:FL=1|uniref:GntR family transcriptional regulator n=1 Tax=Fretibacterium fastidiosum TaxID=651822 RepID=UPI0038FCF209
MDRPQAVTAADQAYRELRRRILLRQYAAGERLSEAELARQAGVSRTPVREALHRLGEEGFVVVVPNQGVWVANPTPEGMEQAYEVREVLECKAVAKAAANVTPLLIARLEAKVAEEESIIQNRDIDRYMTVNTDFHMTLAMGSGNGVMVDFIRRILMITGVYMAFFDPFFDETTLEEHRRIVRVVSTGDVEGSVAVMREHIRLRVPDAEGRLPGGA